MHEDGADQYGMTSSAMQQNGKDMIDLKNLNATSLQLSVW